jgi:hypothetical protein
MWTDIQTNKLTDGRTDDRANRHTDKWNDRKNRQMAGCMDRMDRKAESFKYLGLRKTSQ